MFNEIITNQDLRRQITHESHYWFFNLYFPHYVKYETADFQKEIFKITEDSELKLANICAFRGSGKSTIVSMSYPIWAILGKQQKKFVVLLAQTQPQAKLMLQNLKHELENNDLLRADMGPFEERDEEWSSGSLVIPKYNARISALSMDQGIRGIGHGAHRPDLIICDDIEDSASIKTREGRDKTYSWLTIEIIPAGDSDTKMIIIGNLLHEDSLIMRLKGKMEAKELKGIYREYPLVTDTRKSNWPGKFPDKQSINDLKSTIGNDIAWYREYLLKIVSDSGQVVNPKWIHYYDGLPTDKRPLYIATGVDLAISERSSADYTAMVSASVYGNEDKLRIYILPNPINERLDFPQAIQCLRTLVYSLRSFNYQYKQRVWFEDVSYQASFGQQARYEDIPATIDGFRPGTNDKRTRLTLTTTMIQSGKVLFPRHGAERLIEQLVGFGTEKNDDLVDAFSMVILKAMENNRPTLKMY